MRLRHVEGAEQIVKDNPDLCIANPSDYKGLWHTLFSNEKAPIYLEIGTGKGRFLALSSLNHPEVNYIGIEVMTSVICRAISKIKEEGGNNCFLINSDGRNIPDFFKEGEISRLYLNFPDPWPKNRHEKRRLTSPAFLDVCQKVIRKGGEVFFKSDDHDLYLYSLESLKERLEPGFLFGELPAEDEPLTEFEEKFRAMGRPIYSIRGTLKEKK